MSNSSFDYQARTMQSARRIPPPWGQWGMAGHWREIIALVQQLKHERMYLPGQTKVAVVEGTISRVSFSGI